MHWCVPWLPGEAAERFRTTAGNTITTGMCKSGGPSPEGQAPAGGALATAATLAQGIPPTSAPQTAGLPSDTAEPAPAAAHMAADDAGAAGPDPSEPPSMFPAASLRLPSAELHFATGLSGGGHEASAMEAPLRTPAMGHPGSAAATAARCPDGSADTITCDRPEQHQRRGATSSSEETPAAQPSVHSSAQRHASGSGVSSAGGGHRRELRVYLLQCALPAVTSQINNTIAHAHQMLLIMRFLGNGCI